MDPVCSSKWAWDDVPVVNKYHTAAAEVPVGPQEAKKDDHPRYRAPLTVQLPKDCLPTVPPANSPTGSSPGTTASHKSPSPAPSINISVNAQGKWLVTPFCRTLLQAEVPACASSLFWAAG